MARQVAEYIFHAVLNLSRNVAKSGNLEYFSLNSQRNFLLRDMLRRGDVTAVISSAPYLSINTVALQVTEKIASCNMAFNSLRFLNKFRDRFKGDLFYVVNSAETDNSGCRGKPLAFCMEYLYTSRK